VISSLHFLVFKDTCFWSIDYWTAHFLVFKDTCFCSIDYWTAHFLTLNKLKSSRCCIC